MTTTQHTPGPWEIDSTYPEQHKKVQPVGSTIGVALAFGDTETESKANARLIAAAPELLEALRGLVNIATHPAATKRDIRQIAEEARGAIATATRQEVQA